MGLLRKVKQREYWDLHCHILPGMDDGSPDESISLAMLKEMDRQGCRGLIATSHYYNEESIDRFLARRAGAFDTFSKAIREEMPDWQGRIGLGAEVAFYPGISTDSDLEKLCFRNPAMDEEEGSRYILIEMPFQNWSQQVMRELRTLVNVKGFRVIIAHLERFPEYTSEESIEELLDLDVIVQMNAGCLLQRSSKKRGIRMVRNGITQVLGTDSHHIDYRVPNMAKGLQVLNQAGLGSDADQILDFNREIYESVMQM